MLRFGRFVSFFVLAAGCGSSGAKPSTAGTDAGCARMAVDGGASFSSGSVSCSGACVTDLDCCDTSACDLTAGVCEPICGAADARAPTRCIGVPCIQNADCCAGTACDQSSQTCQ